MSIVETITDSSHFYHWLQQSNSYKNNFSYDGARAVQEYYENLSEDIEELIEFDPIAWCVEFSEYDSLKEFNIAYNTADPFDNWDEVAENALVIKIDKDRAIVGDF